MSSIKRSIESVRLCKGCNRLTTQVCYGIRQSKRETGLMIKTMFWACSVCGFNSQEVKEVPERTDRIMLIERFMKIPEQYDVKGVEIESQARRIILTVEFT